MKAEYIENLILAHCSGEENKFKQAVSILADDEERKGNVPLASRIRKAYVTKKKSPMMSGDFSQSSTTFTMQSSMMIFWNY